MTVPVALLDPCARSTLSDSTNHPGESLENVLPQSNLLLFIDRRIFQKIPVAEGRLHFIVRKALQVGGVVGGFAGRAPFIQMNLDLGGSNKAYGAALALGSCVSFGYLISYAFLELIDSQMRPLSEEERALRESRLSSTLKKVFFVGASVLGVGAQIPFAYIAYQYNPPSRLNPEGITMPAMVLAFDSSITAYSAYEGLKLVKRKEFLTDQEARLSHLRKKICGLVENNLNLFASGGKESRDAFVTSYSVIQKMGQMEARVVACYDLFTQQMVRQNAPLFKWDRYMDYLVKAYGYVCSACNIGTLGYVAWQGTNALIGNLYANIAFTSLYASAALYLNATAIPQTALSLFRSVRDLLTCRYQPTLASQLTPKLTFVSNVLVLATAALSYGPAIKLSEDYYGTQEEFKVFMEVILSCGTIFLVAMPMLSITNQVLEYKVEKWGSEEEKAALELYQNMRQFADVLASSPLIEVVSFLKILPPEAIEDLLEETGLTLEYLDHYIEKYNQLTGRSCPLSVEL